MLPGILEEPGQVIVRLTGHKNLVGVEHVLGKWFARHLVAPRHFVVNPRHPLRRGFDKAPAQGGEDLRQASTVGARKSAKPLSCRVPGKNRHSSQLAGLPLAMWTAMAMLRRQASS